ncbi:MAG: 30S ribosome-binding factor RbfA [Clostridia bacterium]|nr:30S ribosome-binding factor RbfA [Clostridia bacterium]
MAGYKINRVTSDIKLCLSELMREVKDPRISKLISIVKLDVSGDMSYATVYVSAIEGAEATAQSVKALNKSANGFLRRELGGRMKLRKVPELRFIADNSIQKSSEILSIIKSLENNENTTGEGGSDEQT